jgi:hypothetical protein
MNIVGIKHLPNPTFERDAAKARRPSTPRYAENKLPLMEP